MITPRRYPCILALSAGLCAGLAGAANAAIPFTAATFGNIAEIQKALDAGGKIDELNSKGETLLILACRAGQLETVQFLLNHGADINRANEGGYVYRFFSSSVVAGSPS